MAARASGFTRRVPVRDTEDETIGWVIFDGFAEVVNIEGSVYVPTDFYLRIPGKDDEPSLTISFTVRELAPMVSAVNLEAKPSGRRVLRKDFETLADKLHDWSDMAVKAVMRHGEQTETSLTLGARQLDKTEATRAASAGRKRAHRKINDAFLREVAQLYQDNTEAKSRYAAIMERFETEAEPTVARWIGLARKAGYLPKIVTKEQK